MQTTLLVRTLKAVIREQKLRYSDIADQLDMSVSSVKRLLNGNSMTLARLENLCELVHISFFELVQRAETYEEKISRLSEDQEQSLCANPALLLVCICVGAGLSFEEITARYSISDPLLTQYFIELDKLEIIEFLPSNLYRLRISRSFTWIKNGPLNNFFIKSLAAKYISHSLYGSDNHLFLKWGVMTPASAKGFLKKIHRLIEEYVDIESCESRIPEALRDTSSLLVFYRENWTQEDFEALWSEDLNTVNTHYI